MSTTPLPTVDDCWNRIGVWGDQTCPRLKSVIHCRNCEVYTNAGRSLFDRPPPDGYTAEWTERLAHPETPTNGTSIPVVLFRVGREWFALDVAATIEVAAYRNPRRIPHISDRVLAGMVNIRGELHLAVSLANLLATSEPDIPDTTDLRRLLVVERENSRWVFLVDQVEDLHYFQCSELGSLPATVSAGSQVFTRGVFDWNERAVGYLDADRIFVALRRAFR
ncbi:MAG: chemotaxis protein CheW [Fimbriiglobus sp.]